MQQQHSETTKAGYAVIWSSNYIWAIKQLYLARFKHVGAKTKCDRESLNAALSFTWSRGLWKSHGIIFSDFSPGISFFL